jgi:Bax protein
MRRLGTISLLALPVLAVAALLWYVPAPQGVETGPPHGLFSPAAGPDLDAGKGAVLLVPRSVSHLKDTFARLGYRWDDVFAAVPRVRVSAFPSDLGQVNRTVERKKLFFQSVVPLILLENERVLKERQWLTDILARVDAGAPVAAYERAWLKALAERYDVDGQPLDPKPRAELLQRVNAVPPSLALAMAALESGWGTSRFVGEGNNLFGQWTFRPGTGLVPLRRPKGASYELAVFPDLSSSFRAYLHNLNTHWAYKTFRAKRAELSSLDAPGAAETLAQSLLRYSTRGSAYTADVVRVIRRNHLTRFDHATLHAPDTLHAERVASAPEAVS